MARCWRLCVALVALSSLGLAWGCGTHQAEPEFIYGVPNVTSVEVVPSATANSRLTAVVRGTVRDPCTRIGSVKQAMEGRVLTIKLTTQRALADTCLDAETPFEAVVPLVQRGLQPGEYTVTAGGVSATFVFRLGGTPEL